MSNTAEINKKNVIILIILIVIIAVLQVWSQNDAKELEAKIMCREDGASSISRMEDDKEVVLDCKVEAGPLSLTDSENYISNQEEISEVVEEASTQVTSVEESIAENIASESTQVASAAREISNTSSCSQYSLDEVDNAAPASGGSNTDTGESSAGQAERIIQVAISQLGIYEGADGWTKYGQWYQDNVVYTEGFARAAWCAMFVSWCANEAGVSHDVITPYASCYIGESDAQAKGVWHTSCSGYVPKRGDIIFFINGSHTALVESCSGGVVYTIEGNYLKNVSRASHQLGASDISGYASPNYR